jgi:hypothetical protein
VSSLGDKNVRWLDVAVNDAFGVSRLEGISHFDGQHQNPFNFHRTPSDKVLQCHAIQKLHRNEGLILVFADFIDGADVGVVQSRSRSCLPPKAFKRLRVAGYILRQEF